VPNRALATVKPRSMGVSRYTSESVLVAPEMTTVSKPKRRPPRAATMVLFRRYRFMG
jgi:hypothetical protein